METRPSKNSHLIAVKTKRMPFKKSVCARRHARTHALLHTSARQQACWNLSHAWQVAQLGQMAQHN